MGSAPRKAGTSSAILPCYFHFPPLQISNLSLVFGYSEGKFLVVSDGQTDPISKDIAGLLGGRGGGKNGTMQGKSAELTPDKVEAAMSLLRTVVTAA